MGYKQIGKVKEPHGLRGDLYILVFAKDISWLEYLKALQLRGSDQEILEADVQHKKPYKEGFLVKLKQINDRNQSESVKGHGVWIAEDLLISEPGETIFLHEILGFEVYLKEKFVGIVEGISSNGPQDILVINNSGQTFEVPFVKEFIVKLHFDSKKIEMDFPEGLMHLDDL